MFADGCGYVYDPDVFQWRPLDAQCANDFSSGILIAIIAFTATSISFNVATAARLLMNKMTVGVNREDWKKRRRRRWTIMFVQSVIQDCLHLFDIINATYIWQFCDDLRFQFFFLTFSFILIYTLDGFVMLAFHKDVRPVWCQKGLKNAKIGGTSIVVVNSRMSVTSLT
uniref:7TM_GPCR_Srx domain-containing protein n=1 Tax=Caenorhabditis japonica TaxID=281687 RepID=A0A8R1E805_CAEJA